MLQLAAAGPVVVVVARPGLRLAAAGRASLRAVPVERGAVGAAVLEGLQLMAAREARRLVAAARALARARQQVLRHPRGI